MKPLWTGTISAVGVSYALDDYMAVVSMGFFPTPTPTGAQFAAFICTLGLLEDFV